MAFCPAWRSGSPKPPDQSTEGFQLCPVVPNVALYSGSASSVEFLESRIIDSEDDMFGLIFEKDG
jgi:hypothetical protein